MAHHLRPRVPAFEIRRQIMLAVGMLTGRVPDPTGSAQGIKLRIAAAFFAKVKAAFVVKARGGTDDAGMAWKWLSPKTLAYSRRGVLKALSKKEKKSAPVNYESQALYKAVYRAHYARLAAAHPGPAAKALAKRIALIVAQRKSGMTKIRAAETLSPGADYEILRDTGVLLNSLSPGVVTGGDAATYAPQPGQIVKTPPAELIVGTNVAYAGVHHFGSRSKNIPARPLWPSASRIPQAWLAAFADAGSRGLEKLILLLISKAA